MLDVDQMESFDATLVHCPGKTSATHRSSMREGAIECPCGSFSWRFTPGVGVLQGCELVINLHQIPVEQATLWFRKIGSQVLGPRAFDACGCSAASAETEGGEPPCCGSGITARLLRIAVSIMVSVSAFKSSSSCILAFSPTLSTNSVTAISCKQMAS